MHAIPHAGDRCAQRAGADGGWRRAAARVYYAQVAAATSDYARALVPVVGKDDMIPGSYIQQSRQLRKWALEVQAAAVLVERTRGATWRQIASAFGYETEWVRARWEHVVQAWYDNQPVEVDGLLIDWLIPPPTNDAEARKAAEQIDLWCAQTGSGKTGAFYGVTRELGYHD